LRFTKRRRTFSSEMIGHMDTLVLRDLVAVLVYFPPVISFYASSPSTVVGRNSRQCSSANHLQLTSSYPVRTGLSPSEFQHTFLPSLEAQRFSGVISPITHIASSPSKTASPSEFQRVTVAGQRWIDSANASYSPPHSFPRRQSSRAGEFHPHALIKSYPTDE